MIFPRFLYCLHGLFIPALQKENASPMRLNRGHHKRSIITVVALTG